MGEMERIDCFRFKLKRKNNNKTDVLEHEASMLVWDLLLTM